MNLMHLSHGALSLVLFLGCATPAKSAFEKPEAASLPGPRWALQEKAQELRAASRQAPGDAEVQYELGNALYDMGRYEEARAAYEAAVQLNPNHAWALCNLGLCLKRLGRRGEAIKAYRAALALEPDDKTTLWNLANALNGANDVEGQLETLRQLTQAHPDDLQPHVELARALFRQRRYQEAAGEFKEVLRLGSGAVGDYYNLGLCYYCLEKWDEALTTWLAGLARAPKDPSLLKGLAVVYWKRREFDQAWAYAAECEAQGVALDPVFLRGLREDSGRLGTK